MATLASRRTIRPRDPQVTFDATIPRHWIADSPSATHVANGVNLLFPAGERFFVRAVHHFVDRVDDPDLRAQLRGFFGQEGRHARAHEDFFKTLRAQGYEIDRFLAFYERFAYGFLEPLFSPEMRLASTAAAEHFTAILAEGAFRDGGLLSAAHPMMRRLLLWHASEEIEHRVFVRGIRQYVRRDFHPLQNDVDALAERWLEEAGLAAAS
jgi:hypothetical protein